MLTFGHLMLVNITPSRKEWNHDSYPTIPLGNTNLNQAKKCVHIRDFLDNLQFHALTGKKKKKKGVPFACSSYRRRHDNSPLWEIKCESANPARSEFDLTISFGNIVSEVGMVNNV